MVAPLAVVAQASTTQATGFDPFTLVLFAALALTLQAGPAMQHASATAQGLFKPKPYRDAVLGARQTPNPATPAAAVAQPDKVAR